MLYQMSVFLQVRPVELPVCGDLREDPGCVPLRALLPHARLRRLPRDLLGRLAQVHERHPQVREEEEATQEF